MLTWLIVILAVYLLASVVTFIAYGLDKRAARLSRRRIPERRLHCCELLGGWPGAWLAQRTFRHKTVDPAFRRVFLAIVFLHIAAWIAIIVLLIRSRG